MRSPSFVASLQRRLGPLALSVLIVVVSSGLTQSCAPRPVYRTTVPPHPGLSGTAKPQIPPREAPAVPTQGTARKPLPPDSTIEQDLEVKMPSIPAPKEQQDVGVVAPQADSGSERSLPPLPEDRSLLAKITPNTDARRAASLRLTEDGRKLLDAGWPAKALTRLERTIVIDSTNPYGYFYLAKAQHQLGRYQESLNFLDVAESRLGSSDDFWLAEVYALRGENYRAEGMLDKAQSNYWRALSLNSANRTASEGLERAQTEAQPITR
jgi:predicted Zn-dependent protease